VVVALVVLAVYLVLVEVAVVLVVIKTQPLRLQKELNTQLLWVLVAPVAFLPEQDAMQMEVQVQQAVLLLRFQ